ncbi:MAG TPA: hypothetical protein VK665_08280 [Candidatus Elarobacter sp.]|nr:hypothetical protein [Candidatus Elarobacter sp.]
MSALVDALLRRLRPDGAELYRLVTREVDPASYRDFEQITPGPLGAALLLFAVAVYGALAAPFRLLRRTR